MLNRYPQPSFRNPHCDGVLRGPEVRRQFRSRGAKPRSQVEAETGWISHSWSQKKKNKSHNLRPWKHLESEVEIISCSDLNRKNGDQSKWIEPNSNHKFERGSPIWMIHLIHRHPAVKPTRARMPYPVIPLWNSTSQISIHANHL